MKGTALILFCAFALALSDDVQLNANGCPVDPTIHMVLEHDRYCNLFYSCVGGDRVQLNCPGELLFNAEKEVCDWPSNVECGNKGIFDVTPDSEEDKTESNPGGNNDPSLAPEICARQNSEGVLVAHENCDQFYVCQGRLPVGLYCPDGLLYNYNLAVCDWPFNVECGSRVIPDKTGEVIKPEAEADQITGGNQPLAVSEACAKDDTNGLLLAHENCNRFYKCSFGLPVAFSCPSGLVYNIELGQCDWQYNVECGSRPIVEDEKIEEDNNGNADNEDSAGAGGHGHSDPSEALAICGAEKSDGVLVAHENCNQFYKCWQGKPVTLDCPLNLLYNPEHEICDWPQNVDCGSRIKSSRRH